MLRANTSITEIDFRFWQLILPCYSVISAVECYSSSLRYDGLRYGLKFKEHNSFILFKKLRSVGFGFDTKRKLMTGAYILASKTGYNNLYKKAERIRYLLRHLLATKFKVYDGLILPTSPLISLTDKSIPQKFTDMYTVIANLTGLPCVQISLGTMNNFLPFGFQVIAKPFDEICLFDICSRLQKLCGLVTL